MGFNAAKSTVRNFDKLMTEKSIQYDNRGMWGIARHYRTEAEYLSFQGAVNKRLI